MTASKAQGFTLTISPRGWTRIEATAAAIGVTPLQVLQRALLAGVQIIAARAEVGRRTETVH